MKKLLMLLLAAMLTICICNNVSAKDYTLISAPEWKDSAAYKYCKTMDGKEIECNDGVFDCEDWAHTFNGWYSVVGDFTGLGIMDVCIVGVFWEIDGKSDGHALSFAAHSNKYHIINPGTNRGIEYEHIADTLNVAITLVIDIYYTDKMDAEGCVDDDFYDSFSFEFLAADIVEQKETR